MHIIRTRDELRTVVQQLQGQSIGLVPTMGFLHEGHLSLMRAARAENEVVIASIFVNPTQFGPNEDLDRYPRDPEGDAQKCRDVGVDYLWMPESTSEVYASDHSTTVDVQGLTDGLCGAARPGHFQGVTTVVTKLLLSTAATRAYFGEKDFQQLAVIRRMVRDLDLPTRIIGMPIVRESSGLALSSRNKYLSDDHRALALRLSQSLEAARLLWQAGERSDDVLTARIREILGDDSDVRIDYIQLVDADTLRPHRQVPTTQPLLALAVFVGPTRLIDNARLDRSDAVV